MAVKHKLPKSLPEIRPLDWPDISFEVVDSNVMEAVYWFGVQGYEGVLAEIWAKLCSRAANVLEIGGNVGLYTVIGAKSGAKRYTVVEPVPEVAAVLRANLRRNALPAVEVLEAAVVPETSDQQVWLSVPDERKAAPVGAHLRTGVEIGERGRERQLLVAGLPFSRLAEGRDLIKIDAEGIEHALLVSGMPVLAETRPTMVIEVLPEAEKLGAIVAAFAADSGYLINIVPAYGSDRITTVHPREFDSRLPAKFNSKDIVLSQVPLG